MSDQITAGNELNSGVKKKSVFTKWWFWVLAAFVGMLIYFIYSPANQISIVGLEDLMGKSRTEAIDAIANKPVSTSGTDNNFVINYKNGIMISGSSSKINSVSISSEIQKEENSNTIFGITIKSSIDEAENKLGQPYRKGLINNKTILVYNKRPYVLVITATGGIVDDITYSTVEMCKALGAFNIINLTGTILKENEVPKTFKVLKTKQMDDGTIEYFTDGCAILENNNIIVNAAVLRDSTDYSIYNADGVFLDDTAEKVQSVFGVSSDIDHAEGGDILRYTINGKKLEFSLQNNKVIGIMCEAIQK